MGADSALRLAVDLVEAYERFCKEVDDPSTALIEAFEEDRVAAATEFLVAFESAFQELHRNHAEAALFSLARDQEHVG